MLDKQLSNVMLSWEHQGSTGCHLADVVQAYGNISVWHRCGAKQLAWVRGETEADLEGHTAQQHDCRNATTPSDLQKHKHLAESSTEVDIYIFIYLTDAVGLLSPAPVTAGIVLI